MSRCWACAASTKSPLGALWSDLELLDENNKQRQSDERQRRASRQIEQNERAQHFGTRVATITSVDFNGSHGQDLSVLASLQNEAIAARADRYIRGYRCRVQYPTHSPCTVLSLSYSAEPASAFIYDVAVAARRQTEELGNLSWRQNLNTNGLKGRA